MDENQISGGAGPALAAHSKDASAPGQTPAASATGNQGEAGRYSDTVRGLADRARDGVERVKASGRDAAGSAREALSGQGGRAVEQAEEFVREQPLAALAITGAICLALGVLLGRRSP